MNKTNIIVSMPVEEYERLNELEIELNKYIRMFERANVEGKATFTDEIKQTIEDIYC